MNSKLSLGVLVSLAVTGCMSTLESSLVYHPAAGSPTYAPPPAPLQDLELALADGTKIHARWAPHPAATGAVLYCHGNGGNIETWGDTVRAIWDNLGES